MRLLPVASMLLLCCVLSAHALRMSDSDDTQRVSMDTQSHSSGNPASPLVNPVPGATRTLELKLSDDRMHYLLPVYAGDPVQVVNVIVDTSTNMLVFATDDFCADANLHTAPTSCYDKAVDGDNNLLGSTYEFFLNADGMRIYQSPNFNEETTISVRTELVGTGGVMQNQTFSDSRFAPLVSYLFIGTSPTFPVNTFTKSDGWLGTNFATGTNSLFPALLTQNKADTGAAKMYALDFREDGGTLHIGGIDETRRAELVWGESIALFTAYQMNMYNLSICGRSLMDVSIPLASYGGFFDSGTSCLGLPYNVWDYMASWLDTDIAECQSTANTFGRDVTCFVHESKAHLLPSLSFQISTGGDVIHLPLDALLLNSTVDAAAAAYKSAEYSRLCVIGSEVAQFFGRVSFGTIPMRALHTVLDWESKRAALAPQPSIRNVRETSSLSYCARPVVCRGSQTQQRDINRCTDPDCSKYIGFSMNAESAECEASSWLIGVVLGFIVFVPLAEMLAACLESRLHRKFHQLPVTDLD